MNDIICPNCKKAFKVDEAGFADIMKQVRDHKFEEELRERLSIAEKEKESAVKLAESNLKNKLQEELAKKDRDLLDLKAEKDRKLAEQLAKKEAELAEMKSKIDKSEIEKKLSVTEAVKRIEKERDDLAHNLKNKETEKQLLEKSLYEKFASELKTKDDIIKMKDDEIALRKDMKLKLSTKMVGETLEQHCETEFNKLRATAFQNAYFEKDNDSKTGSKGDFIYREADQAGNEIISIMFEMKNEGDGTATKKRNEDFLRELDKDRVEKKCEYAVLVSLLEADNELYNSGIVDVSHRFSKMYVVRPQFFIPIITLLRNAAMNSLEYKEELALVKSQNIDITNFEDDLNNWKTSWDVTIKNARNKYIESIEQINKAIKDLEKVRDALMLSDKHLLTAENKLDDLTIKRLTRNNPTMKAQFEELSKSNK
jgi:hypothetical protein